VEKLQRNILTEKLKHSEHMLYNYLPILYYMMLLKLKTFLPQKAQFSSQDV